VDIYKEYVFYRNRGGIKIDHWDKREKSKPKGFLSFLDFDTFYHRGKKEKVFMNILVLMGVAHIIYDWLDQCPCQWVRDKISENSTTICFTDKEDNK